MWGWFRSGGGTKRIWRTWKNLLLRLVLNFLFQVMDCGPVHHGRAIVGVWFCPEVSSNPPDSRGANTTKKKIYYRVSHFLCSSKVNVSIIKPLEVSTGGNLRDLGLDKVLEMIPKAQSIKGKLVFTELETWLSQVIIKRIKKTSHRWGEDIFKSHV